MTELDESRLGNVLGLVGGGLMALGGLLGMAFGTFSYAAHQTLGAFGFFSAGAVLFVVGGLSLLFSTLARSQWKGRTTTPGVLLLVAGAIGWAASGINLLGLLGAVLVFVAGILYLIGPTTTVVKTALAA